MCFKGTFIEPLRFWQISLLITAYSSPSFKKTANCSKYTSKEAQSFSPTGSIAHLCDMDFGIKMGSKVPGGPLMDESEAKRLDDPLKGMKTLVHTFLESSRMFNS